MNLDNGKSQAVIDVPLMEGKDSAMAKYRKERVELGKDQNGKPVYGFVSGSTPKMIHDGIARLYYENGLLPACGKLDTTQAVPATPLFCSYAKQWYMNFKLPQFRPSTAAARTSTMRTHVYKAFAGKRLNEITPTDVQSFYNSRKHLAKSTLRTIQLFVKGVFDSAVDDNLIAKNPARDHRIKNPCTKYAERDALTKAQTFDVISHLSVLEGKEELYLSLAIYAAMRKGEILALKWENIDLEQGYIHVVQNATYPSNTPEIGEPKTEAGKRIIPIVPDLARILQKNRGIGWLFGNRWDEPIHDEVYRRMWKSIKSKINLYGATSHVFRHTFITLAAMQGIPVKTVQAIVGHSNINTTLKIYTHVHEDALQQAKQEMAAMLSITEKCNFIPKNKSNVL